MVLQADSTSESSGELQNNADAYVPSRDSYVIGLAYALHFPSSPASHSNVQPGLRTTAVDFDQDCLTLEVSLGHQELFTSLMWDWCTLPYHLYSLRVKPRRNLRLLGVIWRPAASISPR